MKLYKAIHYKIIRKKGSKRHIKLVVTEKKRNKRKETNILVIAAGCKPGSGLGGWLAAGWLRQVERAIHLNTKNKTATN